MIFVRHPLTDAPDGLCYGRLDVGLAPEAEAQIKTLLETLPAVTHLITSPAKRCRILSDRIATRDRVTPAIDPRLQEYDFGEWEGQSWDAIPRDASEHWMNDLWNNPAPGGERYRDMVDRVAAAIADAPQDATLVCHAGVIRAAKIILQNRTFDQVFAEKIPFCTPIELTREPA